MPEPPIDQQILNNISNYLMSDRFAGLLNSEDVLVANNTVSIIMGNDDITDKLKDVGRMMLSSSYLVGKYGGLADEVKVMCENIFADTCDRVRAELHKGQTKVTNVEVEAKANTDQAYRAIKERYGKAVELKALMEAIREGVKSAQFSLQAVLKHEDAMVGERGEG